MLFLTLLLDEHSSLANRSRAELLFTKYNKLAYYTALSIIKNHSTAEDVVQKTFIKVILNIHKIDDIDSASTKAFIVKIAKNEALREYGKNKNISSVSYEDYMMDKENNTYNGSDDVWDTYTEIHDRHKLKEILKTLPEHYQTVILYKYAHGYSYKQIAELMDITETNVSVMLTRARQRLIKSYLESEA